MGQGNAFFHYFLLEGKFYSIFSLLVGWGLALQINRTQTVAGTSTTPAIITRRLFIMLIIGIIHLAVIWNGDIIALYAIVGFALLLFVRLEPRKLLIAPIFSVWSFGMAVAEPDGWKSSTDEAGRSISLTQDTVLV